MSRLAACRPLCPLPLPDSPQIHLSFSASLLFTYAALCVIQQGLLQQLPAIVRDALSLLMLCPWRGDTPAAC